MRFLNILKKKKQNKRRGEWEEMYVILINAQRSAGRAHASLTVANEIIDFFFYAQGWAVFSYKFQH